MREFKILRNFKFKKFQILQLNLLFSKFCVWIKKIKIVRVKENKYKVKRIIGVREES